ncbi:MAG: SRPBCC family protein [Acidimicrobiia bacterium]|nr:SRPBCC family protein [Acidimicrobiia bacterium]
MADAIEESIDIAAPPERLYDMVSDLSRMGEWSPENEGGKWLGGATGAAPGARFKARNHNGKRRWSSTAIIRTADRGREVSWESTAMGMKIALWRYRFEPNGNGGTRVTEFTEDRRGALMNTMAPLATGVHDRADLNRRNMRATLEQLKKAAETS